MSSVLYDAPGPRARARHRVASAASLACIAALGVWIGHRLHATGQFDALKWEQFGYPAVQREILSGLGATLSAAALGTVPALALGVGLAAARQSERPAVRAPAAAMVELFRAVPLLILMFFFYYGPRSFGVRLDPLWAVVSGLGLYNGAVLAEIFRAGLEAVPRGQREAGLALGLTKAQVVRLVLLPQAVRTMLPAIVSQLVVLLKDTALGFIVTYPELLHVGKQIGSRLAFDVPFVPAYLVIAAIYVSLCSVLSLVALALERRRGHAVPSRPAMPE